MRTQDFRDIQYSTAAILADGTAAFLGFIFATWIRFESNWFHVPLGTPTQLYAMYANGAVVVTLITLAIYGYLGLFARPQLGAFSDKIPRLVRATGWSILLSTTLAFAVKNVFPFSSGVILISFFTIAALVLLERSLLFRIEIALARQSRSGKKVLILGTGHTAAQLMRAIVSEPRLRSSVAGFLRTSASEPTDQGIPADMIKGEADDLGAVVNEKRDIDQIILTDPRLDHDRVVNVMFFCERNLIAFKLVPDIFRLLTGNVEIEVIDDIPILGLGRWPLDFVLNRAAKRAEDIVGALVGLALTWPAIFISAILIRRESPGAVFYKQERCGKNGRLFTLLKLRTMRENAEEETGPVWTSENDPRRTRLGARLRRHNLDELPQLWNVLRGDMSLVGPRPERPHFVEQFKEDVNSYMSRHVSKPGMTGWAQVNGLRGNTSVTERVKHDLYYLENWSLAFDFKILMRTLFAKQNAY